MRMLTLITLLVVFQVGFGQKIGYIELDQILSKMESFKKAGEEINETASLWESEIETKFQQVEDLYQNYVMKISVDNDVSMKIASQKIQELNGILKNLEEVRKTFKEPYLDAGRTIDAYAKEIANGYETAKKILTKAVTEFKEIEEARLRAEEKAKLAKLEEEKKKKVEELEKLERIQRRLYAMLYGGKYHKPDGSTAVSDSRKTPEECNELTAFVQNKFPLKSFQFYSSEALEFYTMFKRLIAEHAVNLVKANSEDETIRTQALQKIKQTIDVAENLAENQIDEIEKSIVAQEKIEVSEITAESKEMSKGLRKNILFEITDHSKVPSVFKVVSETILRQFIVQNREEILKNLEENKQIIPGVKLYIEQKYVAH